MYILILLSIVMVTLILLVHRTNLRHYRMAMITAYVLLMVAFMAYFALQPPPVNPDPNHTHADFAVFVDGVQQDFAKPEFMSGLSADESTHPHAGLRTYLHLHDGNGTVIHRHKPGLTLGEFLRSVGTALRTEGQNLCVDFPQAPEVCQDEAQHKNWLMAVNGQVRALDTAYVFQDEDRILIFNTAPEEDAETLHKRYESALTSDACRYSKTCPWKGAPPTENCIADPTVPCLGV